MDGATTTPMESPPASGIQQVATALLAALAELGRFESVYLTALDVDRGHQRVRFAWNGGPAGVVEGSVLACPPGFDEYGVGVGESDGSGTHATGHPAANGSGSATCSMVPVATPARRLYGFLCGTRRGGPVDDTALAAMQCFASLLSVHLAREEVDAAASRADAAERELDERGRVLAESERRLKAHLGVICSCATVLSVHGEQADVAEVIRSEAEQMGDELRRLLEQAGLATEPPQFESVEVDVAEVVREAAAVLDEASPYHHVACDDCRPTAAAADPAVLHRVLAHLVDDAVQSSPRGSTVRLAVQRSGRWAVIEVVGQGTGLPPSGALGLHIVKSLVQSMGGAVSGRGNAAGGSTVTVLLPGSPPSQADLTPCPDGEEASPLRGLRGLGQLIGLPRIFPEAED